MNAPASVCFDIWNDWNRLVDFLDLIHQIGLDPDEPSMGLFQCFYRWGQMPLMEIAFVAKKIEVIPNKEISFMSIWGMPMSGFVTFQENGEETEVVFYLENAVPKLLIEFDVGVMGLRSSLMQIFQENLEDFKELAEAIARDPSTAPPRPQPVNPVLANGRTQDDPAVSAAAVYAASKRQAPISPVKEALAEQPVAGGVVPPAAPPPPPQPAAATGGPKPSIGPQKPAVGPQLPAQGRQVRRTGAARRTSGLASQSKPGDLSEGLAAAARAVAEEDAKPRGRGRGRPPSQGAAEPAQPQDVLRTGALPASRGRRRLTANGTGPGAEGPGPSLDGAAETAPPRVRRTGKGRAGSSKDPEQRPASSGARGERGVQ